MCVAVPMRIESVDGMMGRAGIGGVVREISLMLLPDAREGEYVIVHAGYAIQRLDEEEAQQTLELFRELGEILEAEDEEAAGEALQH